MENNNNYAPENQQPAYEQPPVQQPAYAEQPPVQPAYAEPQPAYQQPVQPTYEQPAAPVYAQPAAPAALESLASSSLTMGILSLVFTCLFFTSFLGIIFGAIGKSKAKAFARLNGVAAGKAKVGSILSTLGLVFGIIITAIFVIWIVAIVFAIVETNYYY